MTTTPTKTRAPLRRTLAAAAAAASAAGLLPAAAGAQAPDHPLATCFWEGPISTDRLTTRGFDGRNFNYPEESATYWLARLHLPQGAKLVLSGRYAHARYLSLNSYSDGAPTDALSDVVIKPDPGSTNPFIAGNRRNVRKRSFRITVVDEQPPADATARRANTLYARPAANAAIELAWRVYEAERRRDRTGGVGLPVPELVLADGRVLRGEAACAAVNDPNREITVQTTPAAGWRALTSAPPCDTQTAPAYSPTRWERFFNLNYSTLAVTTDCTEAGFGARRALTPLARSQGGLYSNRDSAYVFSHLSRKFGPLFVLRGRMPAFQNTDGARRMPPGQLRFWSLCSGESRVTARTPDCLADRQIPLNAAREYTIVVSRAADRPTNATAACGVAWLNWGERGDAAGRTDYGLLIMRNMLVSPTFGQAIQRVQKPGTEPQVMGPYFPRSSYTTEPQFEARGCKTR
jgi:hypothetical protein